MRTIINAARIVGSARTIQRGMSGAARSARAAAHRFRPVSPLFDAPREEQVAYWRHRLRSRLDEKGVMTTEETAAFVVDELRWLMRS